MERGFYIAGIGSSAGGLEALKQFFGNVNDNHSTAFIVVSHLPKDVPTHLHTILSKFTDMKVKLLQRNALPAPGRIYVLPGNLRVTISDGSLIVRPRRKDEKINMAIDEFLFSLARDQGDRAVAVILSGMGDDGAEGVKEIHEHGGMVLVQSPESAMYKSMPQAAINKDNPLEILSPEKLGKVFSQVVSSKASKQESRN